MLEKLFLLYSKEQEILLKTKIIENSGIPLEFVDFRETYYENSKEDYIHTLIIDDKRYEAKKDLVFFHGLGTSSILYYDLLRELSPRFRIFALDIPGLGCCSRVEVNCTDFKETEDYFLNRIKFTIDSFRIQDKFSILGHSMGGYIGGLFSIKYYDLVNNLILISPVGISSSYKKFEFEGPTEDLFARISFNFRNPLSLNYKIFGLFSHLMLEYSFGTKNFIFSKENARNVKDFFALLFCNTCTSEKALFNLFDKDIRAYKSFCDQWKKLENINILFFYGENDWNPKEHAQDLQKLIPSVKIEIVKDSGHNLCFENNYCTATEKIIDFAYKN